MNVYRWTGDGGRGYGSGNLSLKRWHLNWGLRNKIELVGWRWEEREVKYGMYSVIGRKNGMDKGSKAGESGGSTELEAWVSQAHTPQQGCSIIWRSPAAPPGRPSFGSHPAKTLKILVRGRPTAWNWDVYSWSSTTPNSLARNTAVMA